MSRPEIPARDTMQLPLVDARSQVSMLCPWAIGTLLFLLMVPKVFGASALTQAHKALRAGKLRRAERLYLEAREQLGPLPQIAWYLGHVWFAKKEYKKAHIAYRRALQGLPASVHPRILNNLGNVYFRRGQLGRAIQFYSKALKLAPQYERARYNLELALKRLQTPPPPPPRNRNRNRPPPPERTPPKKRKSIKKHRVIAPPKRNPLHMPELRRVRLRPFDRFLPYSRLRNTPTNNKH